MNKIFITTSRHPIRTTRRFVKYLVAVIPKAIRITRGKLTFALLTLQALDLNVDKVIIVRNRKGNPGYIDVYQVNYSDRSLTKICTMYLCGYSIERYQKIPRNSVEQLIMYDGTLRGLDEDFAECLLTAFNIKICSAKSLSHTSSPNSLIIVNVTKLTDSHRAEDGKAKYIYEIRFTNAKGEVYGPVIKVCNTKIYTKAQYVFA